MKFRSFLFLVILILSACSPNPTVTPSPQPTSTRTLPPPVTRVTRAPSAESAARMFLESWQAENYEVMFDLLTPVSQDALGIEKFVQRYRDVAVYSTLENLDFEILSTLTNPTAAQVAYRVTLHTKMLGDMVREMTMNLSMEKGAWRVQWDDGLILPELKGGYSLVLDVEPPTRGNIYDRNGAGVAVASEIYALWIIKGETNPDQESTLLSELSTLTGKTPEGIRALYDNDYTYQGAYVAIGEVTKGDLNERYDVLSGLDGLYWQEYTGRFYYDSGIAPHVTGYVGAIQAEEKDDYLRAGYRIDERVGKAGLEFWGEDYLVGQRRAALYVVDSQGQTVSRLGEVESKPSQSIYMTIDRRLQLESQQAIAGFTGALVILERDTGRVLAMVSSPGFDPNAFEYTNNNSAYLTERYNTDGRNRLYNRAAGQGYPLGSVFKIVTMAAALESGTFNTTQTYNCGHTFTELPGEILYDWTYEKEVAPSGILTLPEALMRSCNPWFYHIGLSLHNQGLTKDISNMARAFGLGSKTGIEGVKEETGNVPDPSDGSDAARLAIGQSELLVNPLQVARFIAAVGNGGTLYRPQVIEKIADPDGNPSFTFQPEAQGTLPLKPENLAAIQEAMRWVVSSPQGTAVRAFSGLSVPVYGKTGTAETALGIPHAWFAGYTDTGRTDRPDIAFAVIAEHAGEGSDIAAPIARRLVEIYYMGQPQKIYPWESRLDVTRTPTPMFQETPVPPSSGDSGSSGGQPESPVDPGNDINERTATPEP